ncbi:MAG TPA: hypothetical protein VHB50_02500 [Bryobacteraceae bacterium]|nr:hypothetical protein [Bryobacteraceae bacterium]
MDLVTSPAERSDSIDSSDSFVPAPDIRTARRGFAFRAGILALLALIPVYVICLTAPGFGMFHDDGIYTVTAKALAEGKGYSIISLPNAPPQTKYPPLLPFLLSIVWRIAPQFPANIVALRLIPFVAATAWLALLFVYARRLVGETAAIWICVLIAANRWVIFTSSIVMSESLFALLSLASVWLLEKLRRSDSLLRAGALAAVAVLAYLTRTAGVAIFGTGVVALLLARRRRSAVILVLSAVVSAGVWSVWQRQSVRAATSIENYYTAQNYRDSAITSPRFDFADKAQIAAATAIYVFTSPARLFCVPITTGLGIPGSVFLLLWLNGLFWLVAARGFSSLPISARLLTILYAGMILCWVWHPDRLLLPILPFLLIACCRGSKGWPAMRFVIPAVIACTVLGALGSAAYSSRHGIAQPGGVFSLFLEEEPVSALDSAAPLDYAKMSELYDWIRRNTAKEAVILAGYDPALYLYTGRRAIRPFVADGMPMFYWDDKSYFNRTSEFNSLIATYRPAYLLEMANDVQTEPHYFHLLRDLKRQGRIQLVKEFSPHYRIFRFTAPIPPQ